MVVKHILRKVDFFKQVEYQPNTSNIWSQSATFLAPILWISYAVFLFANFFNTRALQSTVTLTKDLPTRMQIPYLTAEVECRVEGGCFFLNNCENITESNVGRLVTIFQGKKNVTLCPRPDVPVFLGSSPCQIIGWTNNTQKLIEHFPYTHRFVQGSQLYTFGGIALPNKDILSPIVKVDQVDASLNRNDYIAFAAKSSDESFEVKDEAELVHLRSFVCQETCREGSVELHFYDHSWDHFYDFRQQYSPKWNCSHPSIGVSMSLMQSTVALRGVQLGTVAFYEKNLRPGNVLDVLGQMGGGWGLVLTTFGIVLASMKALSTFLMGKNEKAPIRNPKVKESLPVDINDNTT